MPSHLLRISTETGFQPVPCHRCGAFGHVGVAVVAWMEIIMCVETLLIGMHVFVGHVEEEHLLLFADGFAGGGLFVGHTLDGLTQCLT